MKRVSIQLPDELYEGLRVAAERNLRSLSSEVVARLMGRDEAVVVLPERSDWPMTGHAAVQSMREVRPDPKRK